MITSPQFRESPETAKVQGLVAFDWAEPATLINARKTTVRRPYFVNWDIKCLTITDSGDDRAILFSPRCLF